MTNPSPIASPSATLRRRGKNVSKSTPAETNGPSSNGKTAGSQKRKKINSRGNANNSGRKRSKSNKSATGITQSKAFWVTLAVLYIPFLVVINPATLKNLFYIISRPPCQGVCTVDDVAKVSSIDAATIPNGQCSPVDSDRLIFLRIPKTASSSVLALFESATTDKATSILDLGEVEEYVSSIPIEGLSHPFKGYHDPTKTLLDLMNFFKTTTKQIMYPPFFNQAKTVYQGHFPNADFNKETKELFRRDLDNPSLIRRILPPWLQKLYGLPTMTTKQVDAATTSSSSSSIMVATMTMLRNPIQRLSSMYYYDRHSTRSPKWRSEFAERYGNATLQDCLLDTNCVEVNNLRKWCSTQVSMVCGLTCAKTKATGATALALAKQVLRDNLEFVGVSDRMDESMELMWRRFPTFLSDTRPTSLPREKFQPNKESVFTDDAMDVLNDVCRYDQELYEYANELVTERLRECGV